MLRFGVRAELLSKSTRTAIRRAASLGFGAVQLTASGELHPDELSRTGRRELRHLLATHGLSLSGWFYPMRYGLADETELERRLEELRKTLIMSYETGAGCVVTSIGRVPRDPDHPARKLMGEVLLDLAEFADRAGGVLAAESGTEPLEVLAEFLAGLDRGTLRINYDPAALRTRGYEPTAGFSAAVPFLVHCHAWDVTVDASSETGQVVPLGQGVVPWPQVLGLLQEADYTGWIVVDRLPESGPEAAGAALQYLRSIR